MDTVLFKLFLLLKTLTRAKLTYRPITSSTIHEHGKPKRIRVDNGPEFISSVFTDWCGQQGIEVQYIPPGKPSQNGYIERFNRTYRQDVLNAYLFEDMMQVRTITEEWMEDYNKHRPHEALNNQTPLGWKRKAQNSE